MFKYDQELQKNLIKEELKFLHYDIGQIYRDVNII